MSTAEYQRQWRAARGARTGEPGRQATQPHGTIAAYRRHTRHGEEPCAACKAANAAYHRQLYAAKRGSR